MEPKLWIAGIAGKTGRIGGITGPSAVISPFSNLSRPNIAGDFCKKIPWREGDSLAL
jgi:hypothetical protein